MAENHVTKCFYPLLYISGTVPCDSFRGGTVGSKAVSPILMVGVDDLVTTSGVHRTCTVHLLDMPVRGREITPRLRPWSEPPAGVVIPLVNRRAEFLDFKKASSKRLRFYTFLNIQKIKNRWSM